LFRQPVSSTFSTGSSGSLNTARSLQTANLLQNGQVLIAGGGYQTAELYNPSTGLFIYTGSMNTLRSDYTATLLNNGTVLVAGGDVYSNGVDTPLSSAELYNPATGAFSYTGSLITAQSYEVAALLNNGTVLITGGDNTSTGTALADAELYNPSTQTFTATGTLVTARTSATASTLSSGQLLVVGGVNNNNLLGNAELYNPTSGTFSIAGNLNLLRNYQTETLLNNGTVLIAGGADVGDAEIYETSPFAAPYSLQITPAATNILVGGTQTFTAVDNNGNPRQDVTWTVSNSSLGSIVTNANGTGTLTGIAAGQVAITATAETTSGQEQVNILAGSYSAGSVIWSAPPSTGFSAIQVAQAMPNSSGPDLYSIQLNGNGTQSILQALTADGEQLWQTTLPPVNNNSVPDSSGGLIVTEYDTCLPNQANPLTVVDLDPVFGQPVWQIQAASLQGVGYCYGNGYDAPQSAVRGDGAVVVSEPTNNGFPPLTLVQSDGTQISYYVPPSIITNSEGQETQVQCCVGPPMVNFDGTTYVEYEVRNIGSTGIITSDYLYLLQINSDNSTSSTLLSSTTQNEAQFPGYVIPDDNGGVLATWTISPSNPPLPQYPFQVADVSGGVVGTPYNLPFSPTTVTFGQSPTLALGANGIGFATDGSDTVNGPVIASFNIASGSVNWTYQAGTQSTLTIVGATDDGGITITDGSNIDQLDSQGTLTILSLQISGLGNSWVGAWYGLTNGTSAQIALPPIQWETSYASMVGGNPSRSAEFVGVAAPVEGMPVFGLSKVGASCSLGTNQVALSGTSLTLYNNEKQALLNSGSIASTSCSNFFNGSPTLATYYGSNPAGSILTTAVTNQVAWDGVQTNISQYAAGLSDGKNPTDVSIKKKVPICALFRPFHGVLPCNDGTTKCNTAAAQIMPPAGATGTATNVYINTGKVNAPLTQGVILHEALHSMTGLLDFVSTEWRKDYGYQPPYDLKTLVGIETTPGVDPNPTTTNDITITLVNNGCAANN
jgi:hypothetical protein